MAQYNGASADAIREIATYAERLDFSGIWAPEHVVLFDRQSTMYRYEPDGRLSLPKSALSVPSHSNLRFDRNGRGKRARPPALERRAAKFDEEASHGLLNESQALAWRRLIAEVAGPMQLDVLDIGCGISNNRASSKPHTTFSGALTRGRREKGRL
jgi:hypothetical protein